MSDVPVTTIVNCFSKTSFKKLIRDQHLSRLYQCINQIQKRDDNLVQVI